MQVFSETLECALKLASYGIPLFRLVRGTKNQFVDKDWVISATCDLFTVYDMFATGDYNIGCRTGDGLVLLDADTYKSDNAALIDSLPHTLTMRTARGGTHLLYRTPPGFHAASSQSVLAPHVDVRGHHGYFVGPGSDFINPETGEVLDYTFASETPPVAAPPELLGRLSQARPRAEAAVTVLGELDTPGAVLAAVQAAIEAPEAVQGVGGDAVTYQAACRVLDCGVSLATAFDILATYYNSRCAPPWPLEDLETKLHNAARYRQDPVGRDNPDNVKMPGPVALPTGPKPGLGAPSVDTEWLAKTIEPYGYNMQDDTSIAHRPWLMRNRLCRGYVTVLAAPGGTGKSILTLQFAIAIATGNADYVGAEEITEKTKVLIINNEDDFLEIRRRIAAIFAHFGDARDKIKNQIHIYSGYKRKVKLTYKTRLGTTATPEYMELVKYIIEHKIGLIIFDPLVSAHNSEESSNSEMQPVMELLTSLVADVGVSAMFVHHVPKGALTATETRAGNADVIRGASAIKDAARIVLTQFRVTEADAQRYGIPADDVPYTSRLDEAKNTLGPHSLSPSFFRMKTVTLPNGEDGAALDPRLHNDGREADAQAMLRAILPILRDQKRMSLKDAAAVLAGDSMFAGADPKDLQKRLAKACRIKRDHKLGPDTVSFTPEGNAAGFLVLK